MILYKQNMRNYNICPMLTIVPAWCEAAAGCEYVPATGSQVLSHCRWVKNDQRYTHDKTTDSRIPETNPHDREKCVPSFIYPYGTAGHATMVTTCEAETTREGCEAVPDADGTDDVDAISGRYTDHFRWAQLLNSYEHVMKANVLTTAALEADHILDTNCDDTVETVSVILPTVTDMAAACARLCGRNLYGTATAGKQAINPCKSYSFEYIDSSTAGTCRLSKSGGVTNIGNGILVSGCNLLGGDATLDVPALCIKASDDEVTFPVTYTGAPTWADDANCAKSAYKS